MRLALGLVLLIGCAKTRGGAPDAPAAPPAPASAPVARVAPEGAPASRTPSPLRGGDAAADAEDADTGPPRAPVGMLLVPAGSFAMGADAGGEADERPKHRVTLDAFYLDETEVTNAAYAECVHARACAPPDPRAAAKNHAGPEASFRRPAQPVVGVSWDDASAYCRFREKRLPREAEWERAARGDDERRFPWGDDAPTRAHATFGRALGSGATDDVGAHPLGRGPFGHQDLAGNVWEWTEDEYDPVAYTRSGKDRGEPGDCKAILASQDELRRGGKQGFTGSNPIPTTCERVLRGGAFNYDGPGLRVTNRVHHPGGFRLVMAGFRCARSP